MKGLFITGSGTGVGKTFVTKALAEWLRGEGEEVAAIKPIETGCVHGPQDARTLASACGRPELATAPGLYRADLPLAPYAATLEGAPPPPDVSALCRTVRELSATASIALVEGAGGLFVPIDRSKTTAELVRELGLPLVAVVPNRLGVLSDALSLAAAAAAGSLEITAWVLCETDEVPDPSKRTNARILAERLRAPVLPVRHGEDLARGTRTVALLGALAARGHLLED